LDTRTFQRGLIGETAKVIDVSVVIAATPAADFDSALEAGRRSHLLMTNRSLRLTARTQAVRKSLKRGAPNQNAMDEIAG
jgi:hypothetical protein